MTDATLPIDRPDVLAELTAAFERYEHALAVNDVATLDELFWASPRTVRYGVAEHLYGHDAICAFRAARVPPGPREVLHTQITTYGDAFGTTHREYRRPSPPPPPGEAPAPVRIGRQTQTWMKTEQGWRVVSAHVSLGPIDTSP